MTITDEQLQAIEAHHCAGRYGEGIAAKAVGQLLLALIEREATIADLRQVVIDAISHIRAYGYADLDALLFAKESFPNTKHCDCNAPHCLECGEDPREVGYT